jgi:hypothetical protein
VAARSSDAGPPARRRSLKRSSGRATGKFEVRSGGGGGGDRRIRPGRADRHVPSRPVCRQPPGTQLVGSEPPIGVVARTPVAGRGNRRAEDHPYGWLPAPRSTTRSQRAPGPRGPTSRRTPPAPLRPCSTAGAQAACRPRKAAAHPGRRSLDLALARQPERGATVRSSTHSRRRHQPGPPCARPARRIAPRSAPPPHRGARRRHRQPPLRAEGAGSGRGRRRAHRRSGRGGGRSAEALRAASVEPVVHAAVAPHARAGGSGRPAERPSGRGIPNISWGGEPEAPRQGWEAARRPT